MVDVRMMRGAPLGVSMVLTTSGGLMPRSAAAYAANAPLRVNDTLGDGASGALIPRAKAGRVGGDRSNSVHGLGAPDGAIPLRMKNGFDRGGGGPEPGRQRGRRGHGEGLR